MPAVPAPMIATSVEVGAADAAGEQHVADEGPLRFGRVEDHVARRVAGAVAHGQHAVADLHLVAVGQPARGREALDLRQPEHAALLHQRIDPELVARVRADDRQPVLARQGAGGTGVVDVRVGQPDGLQRHAQRRDGRAQSWQVATGVDDRGVHRAVAPDDGAVLGKGGDGDGLVAQHLGGELSTRSPTAA
jgi:hypothetical protein